MQADTTEQREDAAPAERLLSQARNLAARGEHVQARAVYLELLKTDADCVTALVELGALAEADGYTSAAESAFSRAIGVDPCNATALTGLGNLLLEKQQYDAAKARFRSALAAADFPQAHQGLARCLAAQGEVGEAEAHFQAGFSGQALVAPRAGRAARAPLLLLAAARGGNVPCKDWIDPGTFAVTTIYADFFEDDVALPPHGLLLNAIGDAELCSEALSRAQRTVRRSNAPVINDPARVARTSRLENAENLRRIPNVITPRIALLPRAELRTAKLTFPVLLRSPGFHTGQNFLLVDTAEALNAAAALPGEALLAIEFLDTREADGLFRKYRVLFIDGRIYPVHLAAGADWKVHYFSSLMAESETLRAQERAFLNDMPAALGDKAMAALAGVQAALGLDYAGVDFALARDGAVVVFEANATMTINAPDSRPIWDYRRPAIAAARSAISVMLRRKLATAKA